MKMVARHERSSTLEPAPRFCAEAVGAEAIDEHVADRSILGVPLDSGEIVILVCRRSWWVDAVIALVAAGTAAMGALLVSKALGRPATSSSLGLIGLVFGLGVFVFEHVRRLYVLTDRRVIREDRRLARVARVECALNTVRAVRLVQNDVQSRLGVGSIVFETTEGVIVWGSVGDAARTHDIVRQAVKRYGGSMRGM